MVVRGDAHCKLSWLVNTITSTYNGFIYIKNKVSKQTKTKSWGAPLCTILYNNTMEKRGKCVNIKLCGACW